MTETNHPLLDKDLDEQQQEALQKIADSIRILSIDAVQAANSGHPGLPLGCAELGAYLFGVALRYNPQNPKWLGRDRMILSAGHGSMWLYSLLHMAGYDVSLDDIKNFRQLHSKTPGHPESLDTPGVETTTGPLGQGLANAVGQAIGLKALAARFDTKPHKLFDSKVFTLVGDGDIMEGISHEASSLAGHLQLNNLIAIYDANKISLDGDLSDSCSEDTALRYKSYGWEVREIDPYNFAKMHAVFQEELKQQTKPLFLVASTIIAKGSPNKAGSHLAHGSPLGVEEALLTKKNLKLPLEPFWVAPLAYEYFSLRKKTMIQLEKTWNDELFAWKQENKELAQEFEKMEKNKVPEDLEQRLAAIEMPASVASRKASHKIIQELVKHLPQLIGGSADLSSSDNTFIESSLAITSSSFKGKNIKFGVREFCMAAAASGINQTQMFVPFVGTFLTFSDYMKNAIRLASLMKQQVIYQFTHDSIFLGEDGPTHQPVEHLAGLRAIPNLRVIRPADSNEVRGAWIAAINHLGPTALCLSRQNLPLLKETNISYKDGVAKGAYILRKESAQGPDFTLFATGSEVHLALDVANALEKMGKKVRVISLPCFELFDAQSQEYKKQVMGGNLGKRVSIEAACSFGWQRYIGLEGIAISVDTFGSSAPYGDLQEEYGFTVEAILERIME